MLWSGRSVAERFAVGVIPTIAPYFLPAQLTIFIAAIPQARVTVVEDITPVLLERLRASVVDVAILALPIRGHEFETFPLLKEDLLRRLPRSISLPGAPLFRSKICGRRIFLLLRDGHCFRDTAVAACDRASVASTDCF